MSILGEIIKKGVEAADAVFTTPNPEEAQREVLIELLEKAKLTQFGKYYQFENLLSFPDPREKFSSIVPYHSYDKMREDWWERVIQGEPDVTWPGKVEYFAVSSGTTSEKKHIPVTEEMLKSIRTGGLLQLKGIADFDLPASFFEKEILMFGSSTDLKKTDEHLEGEISGISASRVPFWFEGFYRPGEEIASIDDWDERVEAIAKEAPNWDIGTISGIPSWIELMIKKVIDYHGIKHIHEIWPNFKVFTSGGVAFEPYKKSFDKITGKPIIVIDTYLASEGYIATQLRKGTDSMTLLTNNGIYFEFVPFEPEHMNDDGTVRHDAPALKIEEVEEGVDYVLIISTVAGAWRYMIGDTIVFTDKEHAEIKITGRTKHFLNVVGSHLSVVQMNKAMRYLEDEYDCDVKEFSVGAVEQDGDFVHRWYIGLAEEVEMDEKQVAVKLDEKLRSINKNYNVARNKALKGVQVNLISAELFQQWIEETKQKGGQVKVPRVMKSDDMEKWEVFLMRG